MNFFKEKIPNSNLINNNLTESTNCNHSDDYSNSFSESEMQLGQYLAKNKVVNVLNPNENASFSISYTMEENNSLTQSNSFVKRNLNIKLNTIKNNIMEKVDEAQAQNEYSPDYVKAKKENNFELLK